MCICVNCHYVDRCQTYHTVEEQPQQPHLSNSPTFEPKEPTINVNIRTKKEYIEMEWDVVGCKSFVQDMGKWVRLRPGEPIPA